MQYKVIIAQNQVAVTAVDHAVTVTVVTTAGETATTTADRAMTSVRMLLRRFRLRTGTPIVTLICSEFWADKRRLRLFYIRICLNLRAISRT